MWSPVRERRAARRVLAIDAFEFPSSVRHRFAQEHYWLDADEIALVEAATRQWFRLAARAPNARLSMPSRVVDNLWHELVLHTQDYADFCRAAFGRFLHHQPESAMSPQAAAANRTTALLATLELARRDEGCGPEALPLLFRVDEETVDGGNCYLVRCGGSDECYQEDGEVCLGHLESAAKNRRSTWSWLGSGTGGGVDWAGCGGCDGGGGG